MSPDAAWPAAQLPARVASWAASLVEHGGRVLVVGGRPRDALLGRPPRDLDLEVYDVAGALLRRLLAAHGLAAHEEVGRAHPVWLVSGPDGERFELSRVEDDGGAGRSLAERFAEQARRRDLTINAMALDPVAGGGIDPFGGRADLAEGRLRYVDRERFGADPLRVLRVARLAAQLGAEPDAALVACCRALDLSGVAAERIHEELERLLATERPSRGLSWLRELGALVLLPELDALIDVPQDPRWHPEGCVWTHTAMVVDEAAALRARPGSDDEADRVLMWSALLHDLGKPETTSVDEDAVRSHAHDARGAELARDLLTRLRAPARRVRAVEALVLHHLAPALLVKQGATDRAYRRLARRLDEAGVDAELLHRVARADHLGRTTPEALARSFEAGDAFLRRMRELRVVTAPEPPLVRGRDVVAAGVAPGPDVGRVLARCLEIQDETGADDAGSVLARARREVGV